MPRLGHTLCDTTLSPPVKALMIWGANPVVTQPDAGKVYEGLSREDLFVVTVEQFMTDTAKQADIVLPSTTQLEHLDLQGSWGHHYIGFNHPAIKPLGESKSHGDIMRLLASQLELDDPALRESDEQIALSVLPAEVDAHALQAEGWCKHSPARRDLRTEPQLLKIAGEDITAPPAREPDQLQLLTPKAHFFLNSTFANMPRQSKDQQAPLLVMNNEDASPRGLADGARVRVANSLGALYLAVRVCDEIRPGVVALEGKWWDSTPDTRAVGNLLTPSSWTPSGQPAFNDTFVSVESA